MLYSCVNTQTPSDPFHTILLLKINYINIKLTYYIIIIDSIQYKEIE